MMEQKKLVKYGLKEAYKFYKSYTNDPLDYKTFRAVWLSFIDKVVEGIVVEGKDFTMPFYLGSVGIRKQKIRVKLNEDGKIQIVKYKIDIPN